MGQSGTGMPGQNMEGIMGQSGTGMPGQNMGGIPSGIGGMGAIDPTSYEQQKLKASNTELHNIKREEDRVEADLADIMEKMKTASPEEKARLLKDLEELKEMQRTLKADETKVASQVNANEKQLQDAINRPAVTNLPAQGVHTTSAKIPTNDKEKQKMLDLSHSLESKSKEKEQLKEQSKKMDQEIAATKSLIEETMEEVSQKEKEISSLQDALKKNPINTAISDKCK